MKVNKSKGIEALIPTLDKIYDDKDKSVEKIRKRLEELKPGDIISEADVDSIFRNWADYNARPDNPRHVVSFICAYIKDEMFK